MTRSELPDDEDETVLNLTDILIQHPELETFTELVEQVRVGARTERFFRMDIRPPYPDTPDNWESVLEGVFSSVLDSDSNTTS